MPSIIRGRLVLPNSVLDNGQVTIENGRIAYVGPYRDEPEVTPDRIWEWNQGYIWPGLIDLHVHGSGGADVMDGTEEAFSTMARSLLSYGVTGFLATTVTGPKPHLAEVLDRLARYEGKPGEAEILGVHLEGPWICPQYKGAQNGEYIVPPEKGDGEWAYRASRGKLKVVTLAPEQPNALDVIEELVELGVIVSIGHTNATFDEVEQAVSKGASHVTHTFNAMRGLHHREPGVVGAAFSMEQLYCELIADGFHVHPEAAALLIKVKETDKVLLISDGIRAVGMPEGEYTLGGLTVFTRVGKATLADGTLAGSLLTLNRAVINAVRFAHIPIWEAVRMASLNQAMRLGLEGEIGSIEVGKRANLVAVDERGEVYRVWLDGVEQYHR